MDRNRTGRNSHWASLFANWSKFGCFNRLKRVSLFANRPVFRCFHKLKRNPDRSHTSERSGVVDLKEV